MAMYNDIYIRDSRWDDGTYPSTQRESSPDIIPKPNPIDPSQVENYLKTTYGENPGDNIELGQSNYIYMRAKNLSPQHSSATLYLYFAPSSTFIYPNLWKNNPVGLVQVESDSGQIAPGIEPIIWLPPSSIDTHYCFIGRVSTADHPDPIPDFSTWNEFWNWLSSDPAVALRNLAFVNNIPDTGTEWHLDLLNPDPTTHTHVIQAVCTGCPVGSTLQIYCPATTPDPIINTTQTINNPTLQNIYATSSLPANFSDNLVIRFTPNGSSAGAVITIKQYVAPNSTDGLMFADAKSVKRTFGNHEAGHPALKGVQPLVYLGCFTYKVES